MVTFGCAGALLGMRWYFFGQAVTFGLALVILGAQGYFWVPLSTFGHMWDFWAHAGLLGARGCFLACAWAFWRMQVL